MDRRTFVKRSVGALAAARVHGQAAVDLNDLAALWDVDRSVANLENAYWGVMPREIDDEYLEQTRLAAAPAAPQSTIYVGAATAMDEGQRGNIDLERLPAAGGLIGWRFNDSPSSESARAV